MQVTISEAARRLGVSEKTVRRRVRNGELPGSQVSTPQGYTWTVELPDDLPEPGAAISEAQALHELVATLQYQVEELEKQLEAQHQELDKQRESYERQLEAHKQQLETKDHQLEAKDRQIGELHVLLQQAQEQASRILPPPHQRRWWWPFSG